VNEDGWVYPGCPYTGPGISVGNDGASHIVWYMGKEGEAGVYYRKVLGEAGPGGPPLPLVRARTLPSAHTTVAALRGGGALAAFDITESGDRAVELSLIEAGRNQALHHRLANSAGGQYPQVIALGPGRAVVAWIGRSGDRRQIHLAAVKFGENTQRAAVALKGVE
jgi:hypothetical protein